MPLSIGQVLNNRYRIVKLLGQGGFGTVYRAWDINLNAPCALKENYDASPEALRQFAKEASMLANLRHANLPKVIDHFSLPGQGQYLVMEYIEGQDLQEMLNRAGGPLPEAQALAWIGQVCDALSYLHSRSQPVIHRDLKPANIRITPEGQAVLVDFGIAKILDPAKRTSTAARAVTPGYAPFEQYGQKPTDARTDIYALGATLYTLLSGQTPPESIDRVGGAALLPLRQLNPQVSPPVEAAVLKAMQMLPGDRWQSAAEFKKALSSQPQAVSRPQPVGSVQPTVYGAPPAVYRGQPGAQPVPAASQAPATPLQSLNRRWLYALAGVIVLALLLWAVLGGGDDGGGNAGLSSTQTALAQVFEHLTETARPTRTPRDTPRSTASPLPTDTPAPTETPLPSEPPPGFPGMALILAGEFQMGSEDGSSGETPVHTVYLDAYYMDVYEVTNAQYAACVQAGSCTPPQPTKSYTRSSYYGDSTYDDYPVIYVDWSQARAYCQWRGGDLPTEAQWEKAARGGLEGKQYPWGDEDPVCQKGARNGAKFDDDAGCNDTDTEPVGSYSPNGYGLYDMAGNVWEWVLDWYQETFYASSPAANPTGPSSGEYRVVRGGSWSNVAGSVRTANRVRYDPSYRSDVRGFRCSRSR